MEFFPTSNKLKELIQSKSNGDFYAIVPCTLDNPYDWIDYDEENWFCIFLELDEFDIHRVKEIYIYAESLPPTDLDELSGSEQTQILFYLSELGLYFK